MKIDKRTWLGVWSCCLLAAIYLSGQVAAALTINLTFDSGSSSNPSYDSSGSRLQSMMASVANYWEDIIEHSWTLNVTYYWDDLSDANGTLGVHNNQGTSSGKPTDALIRFDTQANGVDRLWYFDTSPTNNSEFNMQQVLVQDISNANSNDWYNGTPHDLLEASYRGAATASAPADAQNGYDLFSVALHEVGHGVGMTGNVASGETSDNDYDFDPDLVWGGTMAAESRSGTNKYHLDGSNTLMFPNSGVGTRTLPSATDVFSVQAASNWSDTKIDLPRQDFFSNSATADWNTAGNWEGNQEPGSADDAFVRHGDNVELSGYAHVENLTVDAGSVVFTGAHKLDVDSTATVGTGNGFAGISVLDASGELEAATVDINDAAVVTVLNGGLVDANKVNIETGGILQGSGTVDAATGIKNNGAITATGTMTLTTVAASGMDLDGTTGDGTLNATFGDISVTGALKDAFDGTANVGVNFLGSITGNTLSFSDAWELGNGGIINFVGDSADPAIIAGAGATLRGDVNVDGVARFTAAQVFQSNVDVDVPNSSDQLQLNGDTTYEGGDFIGNGRIVQNGNATVSNDTTISVATYDWDGGGASATTINSGKTFALNVTQVDNGNDRFDGTINNSGTLAVDVGDNQWTMDGTMNLTTGTVSGDNIRVTGDVNANSGTNTISAEVDLRSASSVSVASASTLKLSGPTTYNGGTVGGNGRLRQDGDATVSSSTIIGVTTFDWDGTSGTSTTTIDPGVTLTINSTQIDTTGSDGFDGTINLGSGAGLAVNTAAAWRLEGTLNMTNAGSTPYVSGSQMIVADTIAITGGQANVNSPVEFEGGAAVTVASGAELELNGTTTFGGGSYTGNGTIQQDGSATTDAATTIAVAQYDMDGTGGITTSTINDDLTLNVTNIDTGNNIFNGTLNINNPGTLTVNTPAAWTMAGTMNLVQGASANRFLVKGSDVNITGQVNVTDQTAIGATLDLSGTIALGSAGDMIQLGTGSTNTISGGTIAGPGTVKSGGGSLTGYGAISADVDFFSSADLLADSGTLTISGNIIEVGTIGTNSASGTLNVVNSWDTNVADRLELNGGEVTGGTISNSGAIHGYGKISSAGLVNNGTITASGGTLKLDSTSFPDLDGTGSEDGVISTGSATVYVPASFGGLFVFNGQLNIGGGGQFTMDNYGLLIDSSTPGEINLSGGSYIAPQLRQASLLNVTMAESTINSNSDFRGSGSNSLSADLRLEGTAIIRAGASFTGSGDLIVSPASSLNLEDGVLLGVDLVNEGSLGVGSSPGIATITGDFTQDPLGTLNMELGGTDNSDPLNPQFDVLDINGTAYLAGILDIALLNAFSPQMFDSFEIMTYESLVGLFDSVLTPTLSGNLHFDFDYGPSTLTLSVVPEPATLALLVLGSLAMLWRRRMQP